MAQQGVAGLGDRTASLPAATGRLGGDHADIRHELGCGAEAAQIIRFGHQCDGTQEANSAEGLQAANERHPAGVLGALVEGRLQAFEAFARGRHIGQVFGEDDAVRQMLELELAQPFELAPRPSAHADGLPAALRRQELAQAMFGSQLVRLSIGSGAHQIAQRLVCLVWHPDRCEITTAQQPRELERVAPIGFDLIAGAFGNERRRDDHAVDTHPRQLTVQRVPGGTGLVGHMQLDLRADKPRHQGANRSWIIGDTPVNWLGHPTLRRSPR